MKNGRLWGIVIAFLVMTVAIRLLMYGSWQNPFYNRNAFQLGLIPWSDGGGWSGGAFELMRGHRLTDYTAFRPLEPAFLSVIFTLTGGSYFWLAGVQLVLLTLALTAAVWILRDVRPRLVWIFFAANLVFWQGDVFSAGVTEVPGSLVLLPAMAWLLRGTLRNSRRDSALGLFGFGLSQAIRPWNMAALPLLPLLAVAREGWTRRGAKLACLYACCLGLGYAFHPVSCLLFNDRNAAESSYDKSLYGRVFNVNWTDYYFDPVIRQARENSSLTPPEFRRVFYAHLWNHGREHPEDLLYAAGNSVKEYFCHWPDEFQLMLPVFVVLALLAWPWRRWREVGRRNGYLGPAILIAAVAAGMTINGLFNWYWCAAAVVGLIWLARGGRKSQLAWLTGLLLLGTLLSLPIVGSDGGVRVMLSNDLLLFWLAGIGLAWAVVGFRRDFAVTAPTPVREPERWTGVWLFMAFCGLVLLAAPTAIRAAGTDRHPMVKVEASAVQQMMKISVLPLSKPDLDHIWNEIHGPSFERYRDRPAFWVDRLNGRDMVQLTAGAGLKRYDPIFWPLEARPYPRTVLLRNFGIAVFPGVTREKLAALEERPVVLFGRLDGRARPWPWATGFCLTVSRIGVPQPDGHWLVLKLYPDGL